MTDLGTVMLVDADGAVVGEMDKLAAHQAPGHLHSAFSVFVFNDEGDVLLHRRANIKYHFAGLWTNSCCSHPAREESTIDAAHRRVREELGMEIEDPAVLGTFVYRAIDVGSGLVEHELDTVVSCRASSEPIPNPAEVEEIRWLSLREADDWSERSPAQFTPWFRLALTVVREAIDQS